MNAVSNPARRRFLKTSAVLGGGLVVGFVVPLASRMARAQTTVPITGALVPNAFLRIGNDDRVTVVLAHSEMGQGIWTTLSMLIAEELDADWSKISVEHGPASAALSSPVFGMQGTGGSTTTWSEFERYRRAGATARALLVQAAAQRWKVPAVDIQVKGGEVIAGNQRARFGELADDAGKLPVPDPATLPLKDPAAWTLIGKPTKRLDTPEKITGKAVFGMDVQFDGLLTAVVARAPVFGATLKSFDASAAQAMPGVRGVYQVPSGVAVVADHFWAAKRGRDALTLDWDLGAFASVDSAQLRQQFTELAGQAGAVAAQKGEVPGDWADERVVEADYAVPYLAHAAMEPLNCTVRIGADQCELWLGTQFQTLEQMAASRITGLPPEKVHVHTTFLGGAFGRRATFACDVVTEAVSIAKAANAPVKTVWTREDDMHGGFYRSAFLQRARIGLAEDGSPAFWKHTLVGQSIMAGTPMEAAMVHDGVDHTSTEGVADSPYVLGTPAHRVDLHSPKTPVPVLWWRSVGHSYNAFVIESLVDELAAKAGQDPLAYRRRLLAAHPRHLGVLNLAAEKFGWDQPLPAGHGKGIAVHESFGSFVAQAAEVSLQDGQLRVHRVVCAIDCGLAVNPAGITAQMESGIVFGLSAALHGSLQFKQGRVQQSNYHDYPVLRMAAMPVVQVHIVPSAEKPGGVGEPGTPPIAPAVANALFAATGQRLRELPLQPQA